MTQHLPPPTGVIPPDDPATATVADGAGHLEFLPGGRLRVRGTSSPRILANVPGVGPGFGSLLAGGRAIRFADLLAAQPADGPLIAGLLTCDPIACCASAAGRFDQPLPALLGRPLPPGVELVALTLDIGGTITHDERRPLRRGRPSVVAVCRTLPDGRTRCALAGTVPVPVLVGADDEPPVAAGEFATVLRRSASVTLARARDARNVGGPAGGAVTESERASPVMIAAADVPRFSCVGVPGPAGPTIEAERDPIEFEPYRAGESVTSDALESGFPHLDDDRDTVRRGAGEHDGAVFEGQQTVVHLDALTGLGDLVGLDTPGEEGDQEVIEERSAVEIELDVSDRTIAPAVAAWVDVDGRLNVRLATRRPFAARAELARRLPAIAASIRVVATSGEVPARDGELSSTALAVARRVWAGGRPTGAFEPRRRRGRSARARTEVITTTMADGLLGGLVTSVVASPPPASGAGREIAEISRTLAIADHLARITSPGPDRARTVAASDPAVPRAELLAALWAACGSGDPPRASLVTAWTEAHHRLGTPSPPAGLFGGCGVAAALREGGAGEGIVGATVAVTEDGSLLAAVSCADPGGRTAPALRRIVAEVLATNVADVRITLGDTDRVAGYDGQSGHGGFATEARAVLRAAEVLRRTVAERAAAVLGVDDWRMIEIAGRRASTPDRRSVGIADLAGVYAAGGSLLAGYGQAAASEPSAPSGLVAGAAVVVDPATGEVDVDRLILAVDAGVVADPDGAAAALRTEAEWVLDRVLGVPRTATVVEVVVVESLDDEAPFGARSLPGVAGAVAAAIGDGLDAAVGYRPAHYPIRADEVVAAVDARSAGDAAAHRDRTTTDGPAGVR